MDMLLRPPVRGTRRLDFGQKRIGMTTGASATDPARRDDLPLTVILPANNEAGWLRPCLEAVLAQDAPACRLEQAANTALGKALDGARRRFRKELERVTVAALRDEAGPPDFRLPS